MQPTDTFLFTDIESSTRLWERSPDAMRASLARHLQIVAENVERNGGTLVRERGEGDSTFSVFAQARDAIAAICAIQLALHSEVWPPEAPIRLRAAVHTGPAYHQEGDYNSSAVNRCARIRALAHGGQTLVSHVTHELVHGSLPENASLAARGSHRLKDLSQPEPLYELCHPGLPADFPALRSLDSLPTNLPVQVSSFVGRDREIQALKERMASSRLVTISGTGGCGKTRLALQTAAEMLDHYTDGVWFVDLTAITEAPLCTQAIATVLGVREQPGRALIDTMVEHCAPRKMLLLLDNCEHLVAECARLADLLLRRCPELRLMVTSREPLNTRGETVWRVPSLDLPDPDRPVPLSHLQQFEAIRLFAERARRLAPEFDLNDQNAAVVAQVCRRLDGIPLAIELAAARTRVLTVGQIAMRLESRFDLLTGGDRAAPTRQQTLRATMDWSYDLLSAPERLLLNRLCVFAGGATLEAIEKICGRRDPPPPPTGGGGEDSTQGRLPEIEAWEILDLLERLVDKSLVNFDPGTDEGRYRLLETIRGYGQERLTDDSAGELRRRHCEHYLQLAQDAEPHIRGIDQVAWLDRLGAEHDNMRASLTFALETTGLETTALKMAASLGGFWMIRGNLTEGRRWIDRALTADTSNDPALRAKALNQDGSMATHQGDFAAAQILLEESHSLYLAAGDQSGACKALSGIGEAYNRRGEYATALTYFQNGLELARQTGDARLQASALTDLGNVSFNVSDYETAVSRHEAALQLYRALGDRVSLGTSLGNLGVACRELGDYPRARALFQESLRAREECGDRRGMAYSHGGMGSVLLREGNFGAAGGAFERGLEIAAEVADRRAMANMNLDLGKTAFYGRDYERAASLVDEARTLFSQIGDKWGVGSADTFAGAIATNSGRREDARACLQRALLQRQQIGERAGVAQCLEFIAAYLLAQDPGDDIDFAAVGTPLTATRLLGAAESIREAAMNPIHPYERPTRKEVTDACRAACDEAAFIEAWSAGRSRTLDEAVAEAHKALDSV